MKNTSKLPQNPNRQTNSKGERNQNVDENANRSNRSKSYNQAMQIRALAEKDLQKAVDNVTFAPLATLQKIQVRLGSVWGHMLPTYKNIIPSFDLHAVGIFS